MEFLWYYYDVTKVYSSAEFLWYYYDVTKVTTVQNSYGIIMMPPRCMTALNSYGTMTISKYAVVLNFYDIMKMFSRGVLIFYGIAMTS